MNMNTSVHRSSGGGGGTTTATVQQQHFNQNYTQSSNAVGDPEWFDRSCTRLKPSSPTNTITENTSVIDELASLGGSLTSLNLDSINFDFDSLTAGFVPNSNNNNIGHHSLPALMATDAPWNESPRSLRSVRRGISSSSSYTPMMTLPPPGVSPLDHLQNSISSIRRTMMMNGGMIGPPPIPQIINEVDDEEQQDITELNESIASLNFDLHPSSTNSNNNRRQQQRQQQTSASNFTTSPDRRISTGVDMDATAHAGNVTRNLTSAVSSTVSGGLSGVGGFASIYANNNNINNSSSNSGNQIRVPAARYTRGSASASASAIMSPQSRFSRSYNSHNTRNNSNYQSNIRQFEADEQSINIHDDDIDDYTNIGFDEDKTEIIELLRRQVQSLKVQLAEEQSKALRALHNSTNAKAMPHSNGSNSMTSDSLSNKSYKSFHGSVSHNSISTTSTTNPDENIFDFALPTNDGSIGTPTTTTTAMLKMSPATKGVSNTILVDTSETMLELQTIVNEIKKENEEQSQEQSQEQKSNQNNTTLYNNLSNACTKLQEQYDTLITDHTRISNDNKKLQHIIFEQQQQIHELQQQQEQVRASTPTMKN